jgi:hypothetical protein
MANSSGGICGNFFSAHRFIKSGRYSKKAYNEKFRFIEVLERNHQTMACIHTINRL